MYNNNKPYIEYFSDRNTTDEQLSENCSNGESKEECFIKINKNLQDKMDEAEKLYNILYNFYKTKIDTIEYLKDIQLKFINEIPQNQQELYIIILKRNEDNNILYHLKMTAERKMDSSKNKNEMPEPELTNAVNDFYNNVINIKIEDEYIFDTYINILIENINLKISNPDDNSPIQLGIKKIDELYDQIIIQVNTLNDSIAIMKEYDFSNLDNLLILTDFYSSIDIIKSEINRIYVLIEKIKNINILPIGEITDDDIIQEINTITEYINSIASLNLTETRFIGYVQKAQNISNKAIEIKLSDIKMPINMRIFESNKLYNQIIFSENTLKNSIVEIKKNYIFHSIQDFYSSVDELENIIKMINDNKKKIESMTDLLTVDIKDYQDTLTSLIDNENLYLKKIITIQENANIIISESYGFSCIFSIIIIILLLIFLFFFLKKNNLK